VIAYLISLFGLVMLLWTYKSPFVALMLIFTAAIINIWNVVLPYLDLGLKVYINDGVFLIIFLAGLARHILSKDAPKASILFSILTLFFFVKFFYGIAPYGTAAGVEFRQYFYCLSAALYFSSFKLTDANLLKLFKVWLFSAFIVLCIVYYRFAAEYLGLGVAIKWLKADSGDIRFRVIASFDAIILSIATISIVVISLKNQSVALYKNLIVFF
jgi:hypothetical protein